MSGFVPMQLVPFFLAAWLLKHLPANMLNSAGSPLDSHLVRTILDAVLLPLPVLEAAGTDLDILDMCQVSSVFFPSQEAACWHMCTTRALPGQQAKARLPCRNRPLGMATTPGSQSGSGR